MLILQMVLECIYILNLRCLTFNGNTFKTDEHVSMQVLDDEDGINRYIILPNQRIRYYSNGTKRMELKIHKK